MRSSICEPYNKIGIKITVTWPVWARLPQGPYRETNDSYHQSDFPQSKFSGPKIQGECSPGKLNLSLFLYFLNNQRIYLDMTVEDMVDHTKMESKFLVGYDGYK